MATALDSALSAINEATKHSDPDKLLVASKCRGLMRGYDARWKDAPLRIIDVEQTVTANLVNPATNRSSRTFVAAGKLDVTAMDGSRLTIIDHKTTSDDISDPDSPYWRQLVVEAQPSMYMLLQWLNGVKVDMCIWDVVKKPGISPKALTKADAKAAIVTGEYFGVKLGDDDIFSLQADGRETLSMYESRLAHDCTVERPERYFQRRPVPRLDGELIEFATELWNNSQELIAARSTGRHGKNSGACMLWSTACKFLGICSGYDRPDSNNWRVKDQVHSELPILQGDGRDVITNSRIKSFLTCRQKHHFEYELGIERIDVEDKESLYFGTLLHLALEAWFNHFKEAQSQQGEQNDGNSYPAVSPENVFGTGDAAVQTPLYC